MTCNLFKRRIPAAVLAAAMLFSLTACGDFGNTVFSELGIGRETGQADGDDPADSAGVKDSPVIIPSFRVGNENSQDLSRGDGKGTNSAGSQAGQAGDGGEGQQTGGSSEGQQAGGGSKDPNTGDSSEERPASGGESSSGMQAGSSGSGDSAGKELQAPSGQFFAAEKERKYIDLEWNPLSYKANVAPYTIEPDLSNVENAARFGGFTDKQLKMLSENGFVVIPAEDEQLFYVYESNDHLEIPSFITVDSVLQAYHVLYNYSLGLLESEYLMGDLEQLTDSMLRKSLALYDTAKNPEVKEAALKNTAYFAVAQRLIGKELPRGIPGEALKLAEGELRRIYGTGGSGDLPGFGARLDYSQFTVRGHYTRSEDLGRYFKTMMWYGLFPFPPFRDSGGTEEPAVPETLQALLMTYCLFTGGNSAAEADNPAGGESVAGIDDTAGGGFVEGGDSAAAEDAIPGAESTTGEKSTTDDNEAADKSSAEGGGSSADGNGTQSGNGSANESEDNPADGYDTQRGNGSADENGATGGSRVPDIDLWENIYDPTVFYVGSTDDLTVYHYKDLIVRYYGRDPDPETFADRTKLNAFMEEVKKLPRPLIQPQEGPSFRFMGQRYIPDSEILQNLCNDARPFPKGLDVMGVLGSDRAYDILINVYRADRRWEEYPKKFSEVKEKFDSLPDETWRSNMYYGWLWVLNTLTEPFGDGYPSFMANQAWQDKSLNTALASWAELRHDTILYGKQSAAEGGSEEGTDMSLPVVRGYVEPNIRAYERILWLTRYARENLSARNILPWDLKYRMEDFENLLQFLIDCSVKELRNEELTDDEYERIRFYGATLGMLTSSFDEYGNWYEITSAADKHMAVITDIHTVINSYLEEAVGTAYHIYVVVPMGGKLYLTRGAVFSYYEFVSGVRLTDEEWQEMLMGIYLPPLPEWTKSFIDIGAAEKFIPLPEDQDGLESADFPDQELTGLPDQQEAEPEGAGDQDEPIFINPLD